MRKIILFISILFTITLACQKLDSPYDESFDITRARPKNLTLTKSGDNVKLAWENGSEYDLKYIIDRKRDTMEWVNHYAEVIKITEFYDTAAGNVNLYYRVYAKADKRETNKPMVFFISPEVVTSTVTSYGQNTTSARCGGTITEGSLPVTARGLCWGKSPNPDVSGLHSTELTNSFITQLTNLSLVTYYIRAYAITAAGVSYGNERIFCSTLPEVTTEPCINVTDSSAIGVGYVSPNGGGGIINRGICWSTTTTAPTINNDPYIFNEIADTGSFTCKMTGLQNNTNYYVRAFATNGAGTAYGSYVLINTHYTGPTITTKSVTNITMTTATSGGTITNDGGESVTAKGVCWDTLPNPTIAKNKTNDGTGVSTFTSSITGLTASTTYYVKAYFTTVKGTTYGNEINFISAQIPILATLTTNSVTNITQTTASCGGNISDDGGASITARGVCWSTSPSPLATGSHTTSSTNGTGSFTSSITGLTASTTYYVRAYATNSVGTAYGSERTFVTSDVPVLATLTTTAISDIGATTATGGGEITNDGGANITARGVCWRTTANPVVTNSHTTDGSGIGPFSSNMTTLVANTTYYVRAYATNSVGTAYGPQVIFTTIDFATVTTTAISGITSSTASSGGNVTLSGGGTVTARGVCWSTTTNPTIALSTKTSDGIGTGTFTSSITALNSGTLYYVRAYATNNAGTAYGTSKTFTTSQAATLATVTTTITSYTSTTCLCGGNVSDDGGASVTVRGVCWSTSTNPTIALTTKTTDGAGTGIFSSNITGLASGTTYYIRAYATNSVGTAYGVSNSITTGVDVTVPIVSTTAISSITQTSATSGGSITNSGGASVSVKGICWSTSINPTTSDSYTIDGSGTGTFTSYLNGLIASTTYYVRAYATNSAGTGYGTAKTFTTLPEAPIVTTNAVSSITETTAISGGNITNGVYSTNRGVCWNTTGSPTTSNSYTDEGAGSGSFISNLTGLVSGITYYVRAYASINGSTSYGNQVSFTTNASFVIGQSYQGGIIFYIDGTGQHGFIAAPTDQSTGAPWGCPTTAITGADGTAIGTGNQNTIDIESGCTTAGTAADISANLTISPYSDWYLPSQDELNLMYVNRVAIGNFTSNNYWSSSEVSATNAMKQNFGNGIPVTGNKIGTNYVRAIRSF